MSEPVLYYGWHRRNPRQRWVRITPGLPSRSEVHDRTNSTRLHAPGEVIVVEGEGDPNGPARCFELALVDCAPPGDSPAEVRLRLLLKRALRDYNLRCVRAAEQSE